MKTSILYGPDCNRRAFLPEEAEVAEAERLERTGGHKGKLPYHTPVFSNHHALWAQSMDIQAGKLEKPQDIIKPDEILIGFYGYPVGFYRNTHRAAKGRAGNQAVVIPESDAEAIDRLDREIELLSRERSELMIAAAKRGKPLTLKHLGL